jgi:hypothetical protein
MISQIGDVWEERRALGAHSGRRLNAASSRADICRMAKKQEPPKPMTWSIYKLNRVAINHLRGGGWLDLGSPPAYCNRTSRSTGCTHGKTLTKRFMRLKQRQIGVFVSACIRSLWTRLSLRELSRRTNVMAKHVLKALIVPLVLLSSSAYSQSANRAYYCVADLTGRSWYSVKDQKFILRMIFSGKHDSMPQFDDYYVSITPSGSNVPIECRGRNGSKVVSSESDIIRCRARGIYYIFNQRRSTFWRFLLDWNSSGTCTNMDE